MRRLLLACLIACLAMSTSLGADIRVVAWNTYNRPNNDDHEAAFSTVFEAIGNESVNGLAKRLDVLLVSETDTGSSATMVSLLNNL